MHLDTKRAAGEIRTSTCPKCKLSPVHEKKDAVEVWEIVVCLLLFVFLFPLGIIFAFIIANKEYEFKCPCGAKWQER